MLFKFDSDLQSGESTHIACWGDRSAEVIIEDGWGKLRLTTRHPHSQNPWEETITMRSYADVYGYSGETVSAPAFEAFKTKAFVDDDWYIVCVDQVTAKLVLRERAKLLREYINNSIDNITENLGL